MFFYSKHDKNPKYIYIVLNYFTYFSTIYDYCFRWWKSWCSSGPISKWYEILGSYIEFTDVKKKKGKPHGLTNYSVQCNSHFIITHVHQRKSVRSELQLRWNMLNLQAAIITLVFLHNFIWFSFIFQYFYKINLLILD